jgi:uracil-DNA glycosylase
LANPDTIIALGVTAAPSLTGRTLPIGKVRGKSISMADGEGNQKHHASYRSFVADLKAAARSRTLPTEATTIH